MASFKINAKKSPKFWKRADYRTLNEIGGVGTAWLAVKVDGRGKDMGYGGKKTFQTGFNDV